MYLVALYMMVQPLSLFSAYAGGLHRLSAPINSSGLGRAMGSLHRLSIAELRVGWFKSTLVPLHQVYFRDMIFMYLRVNACGRDTWI